MKSHLDRRALQKLQPVKAVTAEPDDLSLAVVAARLGESSRWLQKSSAEDRRRPRRACSFTTMSDGARDGTRSGPRKRPLHPTGVSRRIKKRDLKFGARRVNEIAEASGSNSSRRLKAKQGISLH
jgi:hypothetical protein